MELIGREREQNTLRHCLESSESKLIALYGRRRVGKTFLVRKYFESSIQFEIAGLYQGSMPDLLAHFTNTLIKTGYVNAAIAKPTTWLSAFEMLSQFIDQIKSRRKKVIFIDELPWFDTPRSKFLMAFENFWNSYCTKRNDLIVVICGSAASWMIKKILKNKGGLHNRVSEKMRLEPFSLYETEKFLRKKNIVWSKYDITQLYLTTGGIPYYINAVRKGESVAQFINRSCFDRQGILFDEYDQLYESLFKDSENHRLIVSTLAKVKQGLTRKQIISQTKINTGGTLTIVLEELEKSGFIEIRAPYKSRKNSTLYKLTDPFTLFYFKFMIKGARRVTDNWTKKVTSQSWKSWSGFAFERLCFNHVKQINAALQLQAIETEESTWQSAIGSDSGAQIDMVIDRSDRIINVVEIKFNRSVFTIDKSYAKNLRNKLAQFSNIATNKRKVLFLTMITPYGLTKNEFYHELVQSEVKLTDLFRK